MKREEIFSIPNILSYIRILLVPVFLYLYLYEEQYTKHYISGSILVLSSLTDFLDGYIARKYNMITELGKLIDPIADKLTQLVVACTLVFTYPAYLFLVIILLIKDGMLLLVGAYLLKRTGKHLNQAELPGKIATFAFFIISIILVFINPGEFISNIFIYTTFILMVVAMIYYAKELYIIASERDF